jgi:hypothetical protein
VDSSIKFNVSANTAQFQSGMKQVDVAAKSTAAGIKQAFSGVQTMLIGTAALAGLKSMMNDFDKIAKVATRFGASAEEIQRVSVAADLAGTTIDTVARVLTKMSVAASDATSGNKAMAESFAKAGLNAEQFKNAGLDQQLVMLSEAFNKARGSADATNQIIELMGTRAASQMIPLIDNTAALRAEMEGVSAASDDVVRKIEAANDRMTRLGNDGKVALAGLIEGIVNTSERLGNVISDQEKLLKLLAAMPLALTGNVMPLWHVLQTGKTIAELDEIEARATAIAQLTREGLFTLDAVKNAELIAERTKQILDQTQGTNKQLEIAEDTTTDILDTETRKTDELARQAEQLQRQEEQRQNSIRSMEAEIRLIEAQISGNKELEESLRRQADFESAFAKTENTEVAANFEAVKAAERRAQDAARSGGGGGLMGGSDLGPPGGRLPTRNERVAELRGSSAQQRADQRAAELASAGMFRSSIAAQDRGQRAADRAMDSARTRDMASQFDFAGREAGNVGEAMKSVSDEMGRLDFQDKLRGSEGFDRTKSEMDNFKNALEKGVFDDQRDFERDAEGKMKRMADEQAKTPEERKAEEEAMRDKHAAPGGAAEKDLLSKIHGILETHMKSIDEKLPQHALVPG